MVALAARRDTRLAVARRSMLRSHSFGRCAVVSPSLSRMPALNIVTLCTGNAARSVMAGAILREHVPGLQVTTSGTHVIEGMPMSWRTRDAIASLGLEVPFHRSRQATQAELDSADLVIALAREHVSWMRRTHPRAAPRTATLKRLARDLPPDSA